MRTDWQLIREMMNAAIDACERIEAAGGTERDRDATTGIDGRQVSVQDILASAWTWPETLRYRIIRERHAQGTDLAYVPEAARILVATAQAGAELVGAAGTDPAGGQVRAMLAWFRDHAAPGVAAAIAARRAEPGAS